MYSTAATPPPFASSPLPSATACLSNQASSSAYCPLPAGLPPLCLCSESLDKGEREWERETKKSARSWV